MRVLLASNHIFPAESGRGVGLEIRANPSGAPQIVHDLIARGLAELGHEVFYLLEGVDAPLPDGVTWAREPLLDVDVYHNLDSDVMPWVATQHGYWPGDPVYENLVCVSRSLAELTGAERWVLNGLDPADFIFSEKKDEYLLFMSSMQGHCSPKKYREKGLDIALAVARDLGVELIVAGTAQEEATLELVSAMCRDHGARFVGDVRGKRKAELLARAKAVLFPTRRREGCPLIVIEALMSGTPVIASNVGVCNELVTPEIGFVCADREAYRRAVGRLGEISPRRCRDDALARFHYRRMAEGYVEHYRQVIRRRRQRPPPPSAGPRTVRTRPPFVDRATGRDAAADAGGGC